MHYVLQGRVSVWFRYGIGISFMGIEQFGGYKQKINLRFFYWQLKVKTQQHGLPFTLTTLTVITVCIECPRAINSKCILRGNGKALPLLPTRSAYATPNAPLSGAPSLRSAMSIDGYRQRKRRRERQGWRSGWTRSPPNGEQSGSGGLQLGTDYRGEVFRLR